MTTEDNKEKTNDLVDIDKLDINIFIIAKNPAQLNNAVNFINRRGWKTQCIGNISKAIGTIVAESPDILLVSVDHPNPNVNRLPLLLAQSLNTICIGFAEDSGAISVNRLKKSKFQHKFTGFPSGPSLHRFIRQTLDQIHNPQSVSENQTGASGGDNLHEEKSIKLKGEHKSFETNVKGGSTAQKGLNLSAADLMKKLGIGQSDDSSSVQAEYMPSHQGNKPEESLKDTNEESHKDRTDSSRENTESEKNENEQDQDTQSDEARKKELLEKKERVLKKKKSFPWQKSPEVEETPIKKQENRPGASFDLRQEKTDVKTKEPEFELPLKKEKDGFSESEARAKSKIADSVPEEEEKKSRSENDLSYGSKKINKENNEENSPEKKNSKNSTAEEASSKDRKHVKRSVTLEKKKLSEKESVFKKTVIKALTETCNDPDPEVIIRIEDTDEIGIIPVDSKEFHGYFVVGRGGIGFSLGTVFLQMLAENIEKNLALQNIDVHCLKPFVLNTDSFSFEAWTQIVENFTIFEQTEREEIALTFVPTKHRMPHIIDSEKNNQMTIIDPEHLSTKTPVEFNSYIHFEKNKKFYLYLKEGGKLLPRQKKKLTHGEKASNLHINKEDFEKFQRYVASKLINDLIKSLPTLNKTNKKDDAA